MTGEFAVIIPAAGRSSRFGGRVKKPFVSLAGRPVWLWSVEQFWLRADVVRVYVVIAPDDYVAFKSHFGHQFPAERVELVEGGFERHDSVYQALSRVKADVPFVAIHDAVRPLTPPDLIEAVFTAARRHGAAILAVPVADTLKRVDDCGCIMSTVPRAGLWQAQTPQVFRRDWLIEAYARRTPDITDDAQAVEALGHTVFVVRGSPLNFKITTPDDLILAEAVLAARRFSGPELTTLGEPNPLR